MHPVRNIACLALSLATWIANPAAAAVAVQLNSRQSMDFQGGLKDILGKMANHSPYDFLFLGSDGVLRSFNNATMVVTDAQPLSPKEIHVYLSGINIQERSETYGSKNPLLRDDGNVDGHKVPRAQWKSPPATIVNEAALDHEKAKEAVTQSKNPRAVLRARTPPFVCNAILCYSSSVCIANRCLYCSQHNCRVPY